jgi:hippurate hydrolase
VVKAEAEAAGAEREPLVTIGEALNSVDNDPALTAKVSAALRTRLGEANVHDAGPMTASEDFSEYQAGGVPVMLMFVGAVNPKKFAEAKLNGTPLPSLHSSTFAPDVEPTIKTAITAEVTALLSLMGK